MIVLTGVTVLWGVPVLPESKVGVTVCDSAGGISVTVLTCVPVLESKVDARL